MKYRITHTTTYQYSQPASLSQNELFLTSRLTNRQQTLQSHLHFDPQPQYLHRRIDYFGNIAHVFMVQQSHSRLSVTATSLVRTARAADLHPEATSSWEDVGQRLRAHLQADDLEAYQFIFASPLIPLIPAIRDYGQASFPPGTPVLAGGLT